MARYRKSAALAVGLAAVVALATACSSSGGSKASSSSTASVSASPTFTGATLKIGLAAPTNNAVISDPYSISGAQAAIDEVNASGGLAGHKIELDYCNDRVDPNQTTICANQFISDKVIAIAGGDVTNDQLLVAPLQAAGIPMVGFNPYTQFTADNLYLYNGGSIFGYSTLAAYAKYKAIPTALVVAGTAAGQRTGDNIAKAMDAAGGKFTSTTLVSATQADYAPIVASARANGAKAVLVVLGQSQQDQFINAAAAADSSLQFFTGYEIGPADQKAMSGVSLSKITYTAPFPPVTADGTFVKQFVKDMAAAKAKGDKDADEALHNFHGVGAWLAVKVIQELITQNKITDVSASSIKSALDQAKNIDMGGFTPAWTPSTVGPTGYPRLSLQIQYVIGYDNSGNPQLITKQPISLPDATALKF